eukprot:gene2080-biopygen1978
MGKRGSGNKRRKAASSADITLVPQGGGSIKRTPRNPFDPIGSDDTDFRVREIRAERTAGTKLRWLISWEGFDDSADTWEPIENLVGCEQALTLFRQQRDESTTAASERAKKRKAERAAEVDLTADEDAEWKDGAKSKRKAACRQHFMYKVSEDNEKIVVVYCKTCGPTFVVGYSGNISNMRSHLSHVHKDIYCQLVVAN